MQRYVEKMYDSAAPSSPASEPHRDVSEIRRYFSGKTVLVTGATGFLGKLIVEKLLRTCSDVGKIYILVREKRGKGPEERIKNLFDEDAFGPLKKQNPDFAEKISTCVGDCLKPNLGLSPEDVDLLKDEVNCILNCAATVRFDASLRKATYINVRAVVDLLKMAREMTQLTSFIQVSTAYSHCPRNEIDEEVYEPPIKGRQLMDLVESLDDETLDAITPTLLKRWPNTYAFTKAVAEELVKTEGKGLPVSIVKPSIILGAWNEPLPGWIDNIYGPTGVVIASGAGFMHTLHCDKAKIADLVPVDYVVNVILAAAWDAGQRTAHKSSEPILNGDRGLPVYNYVSGCQNPLTWAYFMNRVHKYGHESGYTTKMIWYYFLILNSNLYVHLLCDFFMHTVPACIVDFFLSLIGKKPILLDAYKKVRKFSNVISYFATQQWTFKDANVQNLWNKLNAVDRGLFEFDIKRLDWNAYFKSYTLGVRLYVAKDPIDTVPLGKRKAFMFKIAHYTLLAVLSLLLFVLMKFLFRLVF